MNNFFNKKVHSLAFSYINDNLVITELEVNSILSILVYMCLEQI